MAQAEADLRAVGLIETVEPALNVDATVPDLEGRGPKQSCMLPHAWQISACVSTDCGVGVSRPMRRSASRVMVAPAVSMFPGAK